MPVHQIPVFVGITGKRRLDADPVRNQQFTKVLRQRIDAVLDRLDSELPRVSKILLTGGAAGVDLLAVRRVLGLDGARTRPDWLVTIVLPFAPALFREDFPDAGEWARLDEVFNHSRVRCTTLPPLRTNLARPTRLDAATDALSRANSVPEWQDLRRRHYEQVGLWIVDNANILIAVMRQDEPAEKTGGTARIVAYRRSGRPDRVAGEVIAASDAPLAPRPKLVRPPQQYVWLLDPANARVDDPTLPVALLPPMIGRHATQKAYAEPGQGADPAKRNEHLRDSLAAARTIQRLSAGSRQDDSQVVWPDEPCSAAVVKGIRDAQHDVRNATQRFSRRAFTRLGMLFVLAVFAFEAFAKFFSDNPWALLPYIGLVALIMTLYYRAQRKRWQPDAEDSRAIAELLRLQHAWWRAGVATRVDHVHLQGADQDLARVREGARSAIVWARLATRERPAMIHWPDVWQPEPASGGERRDWIGEQLSYFERNEHARETWAQRIDVLSWTLFVTSFFVAVQLFLWLWYAPLRHLIDAGASGVAAKGPGAIALAAAVGIAIAAGACLLRARFLAAGNWQTVLLTGGLAFIAAAGLAWSLRITGELLAGIFPSPDGQHDHDSEKYTRYVMIVAIVVLPAIAGAMRFVAEKLAYEAEALSYREALRWFEHADELIGKRPPGNGDQVADERARSIVERLGRLALAENEAWLKARRERPLTPVIGG